MFREHPDKFKGYTRLTPAQFEFLFVRMKDNLTKKDTNFREALAPDLRLLVTLR